MAAVIATVLAGLLALCTFVVMFRLLLSPLRHIPGPGLAAATRYCVDLGHFVRIAPNEVSVGHPDGLRKILLATLHKAEWYKIATFPVGLLTLHPDWRLPRSYPDTDELMQDGRFFNTFAETNPKAKMELTRHIAPGYTMSNLLQAEQAIDANIAMLLRLVGPLRRERRSDQAGRLLTVRHQRHRGGCPLFPSLRIPEEGCRHRRLPGERRGPDRIRVGYGVLPLGARPALGEPGCYLARHVTVGDSVPWGHTLSTAKKALEDRQKNPDGRYDVSAHWFRMLRENPGRMQRHEIDSAAFNAISAATDTVAATIQAFLYYLLRHPEFRARVQAEIAAAGLEDRVISYADAQGLRFLQACIKESLRLFGPVTMGFPRVAPKGGITIGEQTFPEGTTLSVHPWVIHLSKEIWGEDAREFNPDRWFGEDVARLEKHFIPFSLGYGSCPGQNLGRIELSKICATLIRSYEFRQVESEQQMQYEAYFGLTAHMPACYVRKQGWGM
ncbi:hypothetical protein PG994_012585 [Apiospora phragmitis]|uniref:Cytochrome P450 n=1 Tax=Apiospora phragmitis TaxID=2905665 RepID=A0ABR1TBH3_9PEZI